MTWQQNTDGRANIECLSLFTVHSEKGVVLGVVYPTGELWGWSTIGGWSGKDLTLADARSAVEARVARFK